MILTPGPVVEPDEEALAHEPRGGRRYQGAQRHRPLGPRNVFALIVNRYIVSGLTQGAVKG
jgi:hypothetical protein